LYFFLIYRIKTVLRNALKPAIIKHVLGNKWTGGRTGTLDEGSYCERNGRNQQDPKIFGRHDQERAMNCTTTNLKEVCTLFSWIIFTNFI